MEEEILPIAKTAEAEKAERAERKAVQKGRPVRTLGMQTGKMAFKQMAL